MKKTKFFILPLLIFPLISCGSKEIRRNCFCFGTYTDIRAYEEASRPLSLIEYRLSHLDEGADYYYARGGNNLYTVNHTLEDVNVDIEMFPVYQLAFSEELSSLKYFNPLCGSLSEKWKESLKNNKVLDDASISEELTKMQNTHIELDEEYLSVRRVGDSTIDFGAIIKGYALDVAKKQFDKAGCTKYLVDAGQSSLLLGEKKNGKNFKVKITNLDNAYILAKNCFISTSSYSNQKTEIDGKIYSHIINPITGSAINLHETVIVVSNSGYLGDVLSTDFVNESLDSIKELEQKFNVKTIVIDNKQIVYQNEGIEVVNK